MQFPYWVCDDDADQGRGFLNVPRDTRKLRPARLEEALTKVSHHEARAENHQHAADYWRSTICNIISQEYEVLSQSISRSL